jgi:ABC-type amino acid transport substrate-binding protein
VTSKPLPRRARSRLSTTSATRANPRAPRRRAPSFDDEGELGRLFVSLGERDGFDVDALRETLADLGGLLPEDLREIQLHSRHSYVLVEREFAEDLIAAVNGETLDGRTVRVEFARNA